VIDLHSHILPGLDDGSRTVEDARALARRAAEDGVTAIAATPHVRSDFPTQPEEMERGVLRLREDFVQQGIHVDVLHGGEIDLGSLGSLDEDHLRRFSVARSERYLLLEFPYSGWPSGLAETVYGLALRGFTTLLAHPERNRAVQADPGRLGEVVRLGALVQLTAASVDGRIGRSSQRAANRLLERGLAHVLASDAHTPDTRDAGLADAADALGDDGLAAYLTTEAPEAIIAGETVPAPPRRAARRRRYLIF
jgi:protein-tyrosine phosphatase